MCVCVCVCVCVCCVYWCSYICFCVTSTTLGSQPVRCALVSEYFSTAESTLNEGSGCGLYFITICDCICVYDMIAIPAVSAAKVLITVCDYIMCMWCDYSSRSISCPSMAACMWSYERLWMYIYMCMWSYERIYFIYIYVCMWLYMWMWCVCAVPTASAAQVRRCAGAVGAQHALVRALPPPGHAVRPRQR
jgi:hypothetical protein